MTLKLNGSSSGYTAIDAPAAAGSNTLVLPANNGSNGEFLQTNGSGTLDWAGGGKVLQIQFAQVSCANSNEQDITATSYTAMTKPTLAITPGASGNKILVQAMIPYNIDNDDSAVENTLRVQMLRTQSGIADVVIATAQYSQTGEHNPGGWLGLAGNLIMNVVDTTVNANAITYKFQAMLAHSADSVRFHLGDAHTATGSSLIATEFA